MRVQYTGIVLAAVLVAFTAPTLAQEEGEPLPLTTYENLSLFSEVLTRIQEEYVEDVDETELIQAAIDGMLLSLDPHSAYFPETRYSAVQERTSGQFGGLGIEVTMENGFVRVISPIDDTPAAEAGLQAGDFIISVDGETILGMTLDQAVKKLRGEPGSTVNLTIARMEEEDEVQFDVEIERAIIKISSTDVYTEGRSLVVRVKVFNRQSVSGILEGVQAIIAEGNPLDSFDGMVLDLRNNPGGLLDTAIGVAELFLEGDEVVSVRNRADSWQSYSANDNDTYAGMPVVVLINGGSASASEIVAGALQDHKRAVIVGTQSFGKGSVQSVFRLGEKFGGMQLTTARYYTPSGRSIQGNGITPDIIVQRPIQRPAPEEEEAVEVFRSESDLPNSLETIRSNQEIEESEKRIEEEVSREELMRTDPQLATALDILRSLALLNS